MAPSVLAALKEAGAEEVAHLGARDAESGPWHPPWSTVINASGRRIDGVPPGKVGTWVDLRYGAAASNDGGERFVSGERFFEAQARAQLLFWGLTNVEER